MDCFASFAMTAFSVRCRASLSVTFELVEWFTAALAAPQRLAGGRAEFGERLGIDRAALRARHLKLAEQRAPAGAGDRRGDAVFVQLPPAVLAHPVRGPGRR